LPGFVPSAIHSDFAGLSTSNPQAFTGKVEDLYERLFRQA
jgi:hypothetical protein